MIPTFSGVIERANESSALQACRNEYTQAKIAIAVNGTDLKSGTVFESKGYYFEYKDGEFSAKENYPADAAKATELANGVKVYQDFGTTLNANADSTGWTAQPDGANCPGIKTGPGKIENFKVYNDSGVVIEGPVTIESVTSGVYFTRPAAGYYYVTYTIGATNYAGIIYVPALA